MASRVREPLPPTPPLAAALNLALSLLWSALSLTPVYLFCARHLPRPWLFAFLIPSCAALVLPSSANRALQLSPYRHAYRRLKVPLLSHFTQDAPWIQRLARKRSPTRSLRSAAALTRIEHTTYLRERFHLACLLFLLLLTLTAVAHGLLAWAVLLLLDNVAFNLYPIWLQQDTRLRLQSIRSHQPPKS